MDSKLDKFWYWLINLTGKTVLSSSLVNEIESRIRSENRPSSSLLYFFCSYKQPDKNNCLALLRSLIWQMILQDNDLIPYVYTQYINNPNFASFPRCKKLLSKLLGECAPCGSYSIYVVLDGLDELPEAERKQLFPVLKPILAEEPCISTVRVYIASQDLVDIRKALKESVHVPIKDSNQDDIRKYIEAEAKHVIEELGLEEEALEMYNTIVQSLSTRADGKHLLPVIFVSLITFRDVSLGTSCNRRYTYPNHTQGSQKSYFESARRP